MFRNINLQDIICVSSTTNCATLFLTTNNFVLFHKVHR